MKSLMLSEFSSFIFEEYLKLKFVLKDFIGFRLINTTHFNGNMKAKFRDELIHNVCRLGRKIRNRANVR